VILQSDHQIKYDGSKIWGPHIIRYGFTFNRTWRRRKTLASHPRFESVVAYLVRVRGINARPIDKVSQVPI
jgi:hypothetical protein